MPDDAGLAATRLGPPPAPPAAPPPRPRWRPFRRLLAPEVVQTSAMDCGPAALKCLLDGHGIPASYGRLREACQTDVDGTSLDTIEEVANRLGLRAEQVMIPLDHVFLRGAEQLPALLVVRHPGGGAHFVVAWRRIGPWLDVMDPASGRRFVPMHRFAEELHRHALPVPAVAWRDWAGTEAFLRPLRLRLERSGCGGRTGRRLLHAACDDPAWFGLATLDAALRMVQALVDAGGLQPGAPAARMLRALVADTLAATEDIHRSIPPTYWTVTPDPDGADPLRQQLILRGAALLRIQGRHAAPAADLSPELAAALRERPARPLRLLWDMLAEGGRARLLALGGAVAVATLAVLIETLLFRALLDVANLLNLGSQRAAALAAIFGFAALLLVVQVPVVGATLRLGRQLELRLRMALLHKLPRLADRYFQSRPISDMAERSHGLHMARLLPGTVVHLLQSVAELVLTTAGIILIAPASAPLAILLALAACLVPALLQPLLRARDLRVRTHLAALGGFYLDALMGIVPVRAHRAERAVQRQHEALLTEWQRAGRSLMALGTVIEGVQALLGAGLAALLLYLHFERTGMVAGADLLLVYWVLKLPEIGRSLTGLARQLPTQQNLLARLMEPLSAPEAPQPAAPGLVLRSATPGMAITIAGGAVVAGGHAILRDIDLAIAPGEHVAIVGPSGAGKSTLIGLLLGWHRLATGTLRVDGTVLTPAGQDALRRQAAWVDPAVQLWNRSFLDNLGYSAADGGRARAGAAIDAAGLRGVLRDLPDGLQTRLGEGGAKLSGGEGQRLRLGRAFAQDGVRLALLDEPFRGLDRGRRRALLTDVRARWRGVTLLCVTHDVGETAGFDRVLVIEAGRIVEAGRPEALAEAPTRYRQLLEAETALRAGLWQAADWRRLTLRDGRVREAR